MASTHPVPNAAFGAPARLPRTISLVIFVCFLLSGASALIYQVAWARHLTLILGSTSFAVSTVLTAFMAGLALGSYACGRLIDRVGTPLLVYAALELIVGLYALAVPWVFEGIVPLYQWTWLNFHPQFYAFSLLRFVLVFLVLLVPTTCMGATLPALSKFYALSPAPSLALNVGRLYAVNTFGAVLGTLAAGFWLMPQWGLNQTVWTASGTNVALAALIGLCVWASPPPFKRCWLVRARAGAEAHAQAPAQGGQRWQGRFLLISFALTGFCAMALEVAWTRVLSLILGPSVYAFAVMLTTFLFGLALGSFLAARLLARWKVSTFGFLFGLQLLIGLAVYATLLLFNELPYAFAYFYYLWGAEAFGVGVWVQFLLAFLVMFVPTLLLGAIFPAMVRAFDAERGRAGHAIGRLYAANTVGAILGAFLAGFVLIPLIGMQKVVMVAIAVYLLLSAATAWADSLPRGLPRSWGRRAVRWGRIALPLLAWAGVQWAAPPWDRAAMTSGMNHYAWWLRPANLDESASFLPSRADFQNYVDQTELLYYREDMDTTITVARELNVAPQPLGDQRVESLLLVNNGKIDASSHYDMPTQILSGHLGALLHTGPLEDALVIGLASGTTAGSLLRYPVRHVEVLEISQAVVEASHYFDHVNGRPLQDARTRLIVNDGRNYLMVTPQRYDAIISEPSNPWMSGPSHLFTQEFFHIARSKLKAGGLLVQWVQLYGMSARNLQSLIKTMQSAFPHVFIFSGLIGADLLLVGSVEPLALDVQAMQTKLSDAAMQDLARVSIHGVTELLARFRLGSDEVSGLYGPDTPLNTDDNALIEYAAPKDLYKSTRKENNALLEAHTQGPAKYLTGLQGDAAERRQFFLELSRLYAQLGLQTSSQKAAEEAGP